jgi:hypothetical protein
MMQTSGKQTGFSHFTNILLQFLSENSKKAVHFDIDDSASDVNMDGHDSDTDMNHDDIEDDAEFGWGSPRRGKAPKLPHENPDTDIGIAQDPISDHRHYRNDKSNTESDTEPETEHSDDEDMDEDPEFGWASPRAGKNYAVNIHNSDVVVIRRYTWGPSRTYRDRASR